MDVKCSVTVWRRQTKNHKALLLRFFLLHTSHHFLYNCNTLTLSLTLPTTHSGTSSPVATQISHSCSMRAQPLPDLSQSLGINHPHRAGAVAGLRHTSATRDLHRTSKHGLAILSTSDPLHQVIFKLVIDLPITK